MPADDVRPGYVEIELDDLDIWHHGEPDSADTESLSMSPEDGRTLVDRLCKTLGYWPTRPARPGDIHVQVSAPPPHPEVLLIPVEPRHRWRR